MKRSSITRKKTRRARDYEREFEEAKIRIHVRSNAICEAMRFVIARNLPADGAAMRDAFELFMTVECGTYAQSTHHRKYRSRGGTNDYDNLIDLCNAHHAFAHAHGGFGQAANLLRLSLSAGESERL